MRNILLGILTLLMVLMLQNVVHAGGKGQFFQGLQLTPEAQQRLGYYSSCCDEGDTVDVKFKVNKVNGADEWLYLWKGEWRVVPSDIIDPERTSPYGALLFVSVKDRETPVCFVRPDGGI